MNKGQEWNKACVEVWPWGLGWFVREMKHRSDTLVRKKINHLEKNWTKFKLYTIFSFTRKAGYFLAWIGKWNCSKYDNIDIFGIHFCCLF